LNSLFHTSARMGTETSFTDGS